MDYVSVLQSLREDAHREIVDIIWESESGVGVIDMEGIPRQYPLYLSRVPRLTYWIRRG